MRIIVEDTGTRVEVEATAPVAIDNRRVRVNEEDFFNSVPPSLQPFADGLRTLRQRYESFKSRPASSSMVFDYRSNNILEFYRDGRIRFRTHYFPQAFGQELGEYYHERLRSLFPEAMPMSYPSTKLDQQKATALLALIDEILRKAASTAAQQSQSPAAGPAV